MSHPNNAFYRIKKRFSSLSLKKSKVVVTQEIGHRTLLYQFLRKDGKTPLSLQPSRSDQKYQCIFLQARSNGSRHNTEKPLRINNFFKKTIPSKALRILITVTHHTQRNKPSPEPRGSTHRGFPKRNRKKWLSHPENHCTYSISKITSEEHEKSSFRWGNYQLSTNHMLWILAPCASCVMHPRKLCHPSPRRSQL